MNLNSRAKEYIGYSNKIKKIYNADLIQWEALINYHNKKEMVDITYNGEQKKLEIQSCKIISKIWSDFVYTNETGTKKQFGKEYLEILSGHIPIAYVGREEFNTANFKSFSRLMANIEYNYNYKDSPNDGCYWLDDLETGEKIVVMPPNPTREGYIFGGWYANKECTIKYNFDIPYVKKDYIEMETEGGYNLVYPKDYVTKIYAKWNKI